MIPHTCVSCGHVYGENNAFVLQSQCCPQCGQPVRWKHQRWRPVGRIAIAAVIGIMIVLIFLFTRQLLRV